MASLFYVPLCDSSDTCTKQKTAFVPYTMPSHLLYFGSTSPPRPCTLRTFHALCPDIMARSGINRQVVSQAPKLGVERSDRELAYFFKEHNDSIDERRGIRRRGMFGGRSWTELQVKKMWKNIDGPNPGGNQHMPSRVPVGGRPEKVNSHVGSSVVRI